MATLREVLTKADLLELENRMLRELGDIRREMNALVKWLVGLQLLGLGGVAAIVGFLG